LREEPTNAAEYERNTSTVTTAPTTATMIPDFTKVVSDHSPLIETKSSPLEQTLTKAKSTSGLPKSLNTTPSVRNKEDFRLNINKDFFGGLHESHSATTKKLAHSSTEAQLIQDNTRKKSTQRGITDLSQTLKFKNTPWTSSPAPCEEEKTRLYNKFKKHLVNI